MKTYEDIELEVVTDELHIQAIHQIDVCVGFFGHVLGSALTFVLAGPVVVCAFTLLGV